MFIEPTITWVPSGFSGYTWLDTKIDGKKKKKKTNRQLLIIMTLPSYTACGCCRVNENGR